jgi:hypothetical protein
MYDPKYFFVPNVLNRYTLSERNKFVTNADGSVDLYLQADSPGKDKEANWLPAPKAKFIPMMRLYWPKETPPSIIDGSWNRPLLSKWNRENVGVRRDRVFFGAPCSLRRISYADALGSCRRRIETAPFCRNRLDLIYAADLFV